MTQPAKNSQGRDRPLVDRSRAESVLEAFKGGAFDVLASPVAPADFAAVARNAEEFLTLASAGPGPAPDDANLNGIVAVSEPMQRLMELVPRLGAARCNILISGEQGTGRETIAALLHRSSGRSRARFVKVDGAGALLPELRRALFGAADGGNGVSRPSDEGPQPGLFTEAGGGTLYLEHLADLPLPVQARLARQIRQKDGPHGANVRVVTAVEPDVAAQVGEGRIRSDLYQLLSLVRVDVPPLRARREDLPFLARQVLADLCRSKGYPRKTITKSALTLLTALPWPGNLPELRGLLERLVAMLPGGVIRLEDVLAHVSLDGSELRGPEYGSTLREARERFERDYIAATLRRHRGRMAEAARTLGMQRTNLYRKVRLLNLTRQGA